MEPGEGPYPPGVIYRQRFTLRSYQGLNCSHQASLQLSDFKHRQPLAWLAAPRSTLTGITRWINLIPDGTTVSGANSGKLSLVTFMTLTSQSATLY